MKLSKHNFIINQQKMNVKQFSIGTLVGAVVLFLLGFLVYAVLFSTFFEANLGSATGVNRADDSMVMPVLFLGNIALAGLLTYIYLQWAQISTFMTGLKGGLIIGLLMNLGHNLIMYSTTNIMNITGALVDVVLYTIVIGLTGGVIGLVLGRVKK